MYKEPVKPVLGDLPDYNIALKRRVASAGGYLMGKINVGRVILGGLLAGLVINIGESILNLAIAGERMELAYRELNLQPSPGCGRESSTV